MHQSETLNKANTQRIRIHRTPGNAAIFLFSDGLLTLRVKTSWSTIRELLVVKEKMQVTTHSQLEDD
ncbi:hypothetical protein PAXRUDRAFT_825366 [Paxillus rubicundulus Ve08.2h10]|uniref:Uncharacterized protein n=1 Tax=Paxillus rubicundulus Ve08.2h10 TaxID=930991 RepID=A0A0D0E6C8_9AGAM|nr:hypothetical protein PAXRUDRAFT_825366 [Paxillus rubicundulus Ve08.2h10]